MNRLRCFLFAAIMVISSSMLALGGEMQAPGKNDPIPTPTPNALITATNDGSQPTTTEPNQIAWQDDATSMLLELLLTIF